MDSNKLANWLQVGANIGIVGGLVLVALQLEQNSDLARRDIDAPEEMSGEDLMSVYFYLDVHYDRLDFVFTLNQITELTESVKEVLQWHASNVFGANGVARAWWSAKTTLNESTAWARYTDKFVQRDDIAPEFETFMTEFCKSVSANQNCETP